MTEQHRPSYVALVAAMRAEFLATALESLWIQMREHRHNTSSLGLLAQAVHDAQDLAYDAGESPAESRAKVDELTAENLRLREQAFAQKPVIDAAEAWGEAWEGLKGDDTVPYAVAQPSAALHDAVESYRLMDLALTTARDEAGVAQ